MIQPSLDLRQDRSTGRLARRREQRARILEQLLSGTITDKERQKREEELAKQRERSRLRYAANLERERSKDRLSYAVNLEKQRARKRKYYADNIEKEHARDRQRKYTPEHLATLRLKRAAKRDARRLADAAFSEKRYEKKIQSTKNKRAANKLKYRYRLRQRTPSWVDIKEINQIYLACPEGMTVDHIVPLNGITPEGYEVSGLHVPWNLQYLFASENFSKQHKMRDHEIMLACIPPSLREPAQTRVPGECFT